MSRPFHIEGYAIVSADGMIANVEGVMPDALKIEADQRFFHCSLDRAGAVAHGRHSQETDGGAPQRRRLILTRRIAALAPDPQNDKAVWWNSAGASLEQAWEALGAPRGPLAVIGGTEVFGLFLAIGYDAFHQPGRQGAAAGRAAGISRRRAARARGFFGGARARARCGANAR